MSQSVVPSLVRVSTSSLHDTVRPHFTKIKFDTINELKYSVSPDSHSVPDVVLNKKILCNVLLLSGVTLSWTP